MIAKEYNKETMAKVTGRSLPISTKQAIEICNFIRGKNVQNMKAFLGGVMRGEEAVRFTRFNKGVGHKPGIGPGRYPIKASKEILDLLKSAEANAQFKVLNTANLIIGHISANKASDSWHYGRQRRRKMKRTNVEVILAEKVQKKDEPKKTEELLSETKKMDNKTEEGTEKSSISGTSPQIQRKKEK